jgi:hypothetical protein
MAKKQKPKQEKNGIDSSEELWIAPRYSLKGPAGERAWENRTGGAPSSSRYLELADIALGLKKTAPHRKKTRPRQLTTEKRPSLTLQNEVENIA